MSETSTTSQTPAQAAETTPTFEGSLSFEQTPALNINVPEGAKIEDVNSTLKAIGLEGVDQLKSFATRFDEAQKNYSTVQAKYDQLKADFEAKTSVSPFANPLVENLNKLYSEKASPEKIQHFMNIQSMNVDAMDASQAIRQQMKLKFPELGDAEINATIQTRYKITEGEDADEIANNAVRAQMKIDAQEAKSWLKSQQVTHEKSPEQIAKEQQQQQRQEQYVNTWKTLSGRVLNETADVIKFEENSKQIGGDYSFEYNPKLTDEEKSQVEAQLHQFALNNKLPLTEDSLGKIAEFKNRLVKMMKIDDFIKHMAYDIVAGMTEQSTKRKGTHSAPPPPPPKANRGATPAPKKPSGPPRSRGDQMI